MKTVRQRYMNDQSFHTLVDWMVHHINQCDYTPSEIRQAAVLACIIHEEHNLYKAIRIPAQVEAELRKARKIFDDWENFNQYKKENKKNDNKKN